MQGVFLQHPQESRSHSDQVLTLAKEGHQRVRSSMLKVCKQNRSSHAVFSQSARAGAIQFVQVQDREPKKICPCPA